MPMLYPQDSIAGHAAPRGVTQWVFRRALDRGEYWELVALHILNHGVCRVRVIFDDHTCKKHVTFLQPARRQLELPCTQPSDSDSKSQQLFPPISPVFVGRAVHTPHPGARAKYFLFVVLLCVPWLASLSPVSNVAHAVQFSEMVSSEVTCDLWQSPALVWKTMQTTCVIKFLTQKTTHTWAMGSASRTEGRRTYVR